MTNPATVADHRRHVRIRPIDDADRDALTVFYAALSPDSLEARFHGAAGDRRPGGALPVRPGP